MRAVGNAISSDSKSRKTTLSSCCIGSIGSDTLTATMNISRNFLLWCSEQRWLQEQAMRRRFARKSFERFMPGEDLGAGLEAAMAFVRRLAERPVNVWFRLKNLF